MTKIRIEIDTENENGLAIATAKPTVALISTINAANLHELDKSFKKGVKDVAHYTISSNENLTYKKDAGGGPAVPDLERELGTAVNGIVATAGGIVAYEAAARVNVNNFVSLVGAVPDAIHSKCWGGVSLESYNANVARIEMLRAKGFNLSEIGLFYNRNSTMSAKEVPQWDALVGAHNQTFPGGNLGNRDNSATTYTNDLAAAAIPPNRIRALVISADPFFQDTMNELISALNVWIGNTAATGGRAPRVCYPFVEYEKNRPNQPTGGSSSIFGPSLVSAYYWLGLIAARAHQDQAFQGFIGVPNVSKDIP